MLEVAEMLASGRCTGCAYEVLHGKLPPEEKDAIMRAFSQAPSTCWWPRTVIEVGVDVPNSSVMIIMDARTGSGSLAAAPAQGRVGRRRAARAVPALHRVPRGHPREGAPRGGRLHARRVRAVEGRWTRAA
ncbi:helicase-related protein [Nonomuraea dietziae]|uniref:helicase-related protein n=1 Tax=Nonomuraea dietziae TaxID=65515 RepID=UPI0031D2F653